MKTRILVGAILTTTVVGILALDAWLRSKGVLFPCVGGAILFVLMILGYRELFSMIATKVPSMARNSAVVSAAGLVVMRAIDVGIPSVDFSLAFYAIVYVALVFVPEIVAPRIDTAGLRVCGRAFGLLYLLPITLVFDLGVAHGPVVIGVVVLCAKCSDIGAYFAGKFIGGPKLAPIVSPNKTIAGLIGGMILSSVAVIVAGDLVPGDPPVWARIALGVGFTLFGQLGDLSESVLKRTFGVKDSGVSVGEVGGVLDLFDSLVLAVPVGYLFVVDVFPTL